uniref:5'-nucleotidase n=1 Tax=Octopus bimaculoides TaxID=37653 RepID=A0A0L8HDE4_OCTBM|eukprot:XP_014773225.1 PREDICTED: 5'-nucleotidase-like isoform X2 [Octopus bimaculoides]
MSPFCCESQTSKLLQQLGSLYILTLTIQTVISTGSTSSDHLTILHTNDFHSKFQQLNKYSSLCKQKDIDAGRCYGGIARIATKVKEIRGQDPNVLLLDAGDQFQGSFWFHHFKGYASSYFMNEIKYDAMCLGNHEFDGKISGLATFLKNVTFPVVCANINVTGIDEMQPVVKRIKLDVGGYQVGIVGYITVTTAVISKPDPIVFLDEVESVRQQVKELQKEGVDRIIALGHAGIEMDRKIAQEVKGVDIVIGGHTNTFLYSGDPPSIEKPEGSYPEVITQKDGEKALVVQEFAFGKYLGYLRVEFDSKGRVKSWSGNPILLNNSVEQDPDILSKMEPFMNSIEPSMKTVIGQSSVLLLGSNLCRKEECNLGNLVADSMVFSYIDFSGDDAWSSNAISLVNGGAVRTAIEPGNITYAHIAEVLPFENVIDIVEASGKLLLEILEHSVKDYKPTNGKFLQVSV